LRETFPSCFRIAAARDIEALKKSEKKIKGKYVIIVFRENNLSYARLLVVVSSRVGNAVMRNRIKRIIREIFRKQLRDIAGYDLMIIARTVSADAGYREIEKDILSRIKSLGGDC